MSDAFDPYYKWLGIPPREQPPNHYRLLTINLFENDPQVIEAAADRQMAFLRTLQTGQHVQDAQRLLNEISQARVCLLNAPKKAEYDATLRKLEVGRPGVAPASRQAPETPSTAPRPMPQARRLEPDPISVAPAPLTRLVLAAPASTAPASTGPRPLWRQPAVLFVALSIPVIALAAVWLTGGETPQAVAVAPPKQPDKIESSPSLPISPIPEQPAVDASSSPPNVDPMPPATPSVPPTTEPSSATAADRAVASVPAVATTNPAPLTAGSQESGLRIDLLKQIDVSKHVVRGNPVRTGVGLSSLTSAFDEWALFQIPYRPGNREYALEIVAELVNKGGPLNVGLVSPRSSFLVSLDYAGRTGLSLVDGGQHFAIPGAALSSGSIFGAGARPTIRINVRQRGVEVLADGRLLLQWRNYSRLAPNESWQGPDKETLSIGWNLGTFRIDKLDVIQLSGRFTTPAVNAPTTVAAADEQPSPGPASTLPSLSDRQAAPPAKDLQAAEQQVRTVFRDEFEKAAKSDAKSRPEAKAALARTLADQSDQTRANPAEHYTMLKLSLDAAAEAGDAELALKVLGLLGASYKLDPTAVVAPALTELARTVKTPEARPRIVEAALEHIEFCLADDKFEAATQLATLAMSTASKLRDNDLRKTVKDQQDQVKLLQKQYQTASAAAETLKQDPDDPAANLAWGKYLCLVKEDWEAGLPLLAKSADAGLKAAAAKELAAEKKPEDKSALGDAWVDLAKAAPAADRGAFEARADFWYQDALDELTGLAKAHVERRLSDLKASEAAKPAVAARPKKNQPPKPGMAGRVILDNGDSGLTVFYQPGMQLRDETLKGALAKSNIKWRPLQVDLGGYFTLPVTASVFFHQSCQGPADAGCRLFVDNKEIFTVGAADPSSTHGRSMNPGVHSIRWVVAGRDAIGQCDLRVYYHNPATSNSENLSIVYLPQGLVTPRQVKFKGEADLSSN